MKINPIKKCLDCRKQPIYRYSIRCANCYHKKQIQDPIKRFFKYVYKTPKCWNWTGAKSKGYGRFYFINRTIQSSNYSWELKNGPIPIGKFVLHHCDNRQCVNPKHLFIGTHQDNMDDMCKKGRHKCKLTPDIVREIRKLYIKNKHKGLPRKYGVSKFAIRMIANRRTWKHIN